MRRQRAKEKKSTALLILPYLVCGRVAYPAELFIQKLNWLEKLNILRRCNALDIFTKVHLYCSHLGSLSRLAELQPVCAEGYTDLKCHYGQLLHWITSSVTPKVNGFTEGVVYRPGVLAYSHVSHLWQSGTDVSEHVNWGK